MEFTYINCARHYDICRNKDLDRIPKIQLLKPHKRDKKFGYDTINFDKDFGMDGIKAFLQVNHKFDC